MSIFLRSKMAAAEETRGRGAGQRVAGLGRFFFFFTSSELRDRSMLPLQSHFCLGRSWALRYDQERDNKKTSLPMKNGEKFMESKTGLQSSADRS